MKKDLIFEELERMREIMGVKNSFKKRVNISKMLNETTLLFEAGPVKGGDPESLFKALSGERIVDELTTAQVKYIDNFEAALQRNLAGTEVGTMDDLIKSMEKYYGKLPGDGLTPNQILGYIKRRPQLAQSFEEAILKSTTELFEKRVANYGVKDILKAADMEYLYDDIMELSNQTINSTTRESVQELVNAQRKMLNDLKNSGKLTDNQKIGIEELEEHLNTVESRIKTDRENSKIYDGLVEEPINPKTTNYEDDMTRMFGDDVSDIVEGEVKDWKVKLRERMNKLKIESADQQRFIENAEKLYDRLQGAKKELYDYIDGMTDKEFAIYCKNVEKQLDTAINTVKDPWWRTKLDEWKKRVGKQDKSDIRFLIEQSFTPSAKAGAYCVGYQGAILFAKYKTSDFEPREFAEKMAERGWAGETGLNIGGEFVDIAMECTFAMLSPGLFVPYAIISNTITGLKWAFGADKYDNTLDDFKKFIESKKEYDKPDKSESDGYYAFKKSETGNFDIKTLFVYDKDDKTFIVKDSESKSETQTKYDNNPAGYKKFIEDNNKTYGNAGGYVHQSGTPLYKDGTGKWQAGEYKDGTFVIPGLK